MVGLAPWQLLTFYGNLGVCGLVLNAMFVVLSQLFGLMCTAPKIVSNREPIRRVAW